MVSISFYGPAMAGFRPGPSAPRARQKTEQQQYRPPGRSFYTSPSSFSTPKHSSMAESISFSKYFGEAASSHAITSISASCGAQQHSVIAYFARTRREKGIGGERKKKAGKEEWEEEGGSADKAKKEEGKGEGNAKNGTQGETGGKEREKRAWKEGDNHHVGQKVVAPSTLSLQGGSAAYPLASRAPSAARGQNVAFSHSPENADSSPATKLSHEAQPAFNVASKTSHYGSFANLTSPPHPAASSSAPKPRANKSMSSFPIPCVRAGALWVPKLHAVNPSVTPTNLCQTATSSALVCDGRSVDDSTHEAPSRASSKHVTSHDTLTNTNILRSEAIAIESDSTCEFSRDIDPPPPFYKEKPKPVGKNGIEAARSAPRDWSSEAQQLRKQVFALYSTRVEDFKHLAEQAATLYTEYVPTVLCDLRDITFWFRNPTERGPKGEMVLPMSNNGAQLFANSAFFEALAHEMTKKMTDIHPINVVYLLWTFTRKFGCKNIPGVYRSASPHLAQHLEDLDRCGIGMVPWCYTKANIFDEQLLEACASDLCRRSALDIDQHSPIPEHQLAPRNVQNTCWAYARAFHRRPKPNYLLNLFQEMARVAYKLLQHRPKDGPKTVHTLCRGYTTETGKLVPADSFRLMSLGLIAQSFKNVGIGLPAELDYAMEQYTLQGLALSPHECDKFFLMDSYDVVLASRTLTLTPALTEALKRVAGRHLSRLTPKDKAELRVLGISAA